MPLASIASAYPARRFLSAAMACLLLSAAFGADARTQPSQFQIVESVPEASVYGEPGVPRTQQTWLAMINGAKQRIDIAAFYISEKPGTGLTPVLDALSARARAGVVVHLLVDHTFLAKNPDSVAWLGKVPGITVRVLPVDTLTGGVLHAKYMIVDDASVFVGSQNWDWRALEQIHEIGARIDDARFAKTFAASFDYSWRLADEGDLAKAQARGVQPPDFAPVTATDPVLLDAGSAAPLVAFPAFSPPALQPAWVSAEEPALVEMIHASQHALRIQVMTLSAIRSFGPKGWWAPVDGAIRDAAARGVQVHIIVADWALREPMQAYLKSLAALPNITVKFSRLPLAPQGFIPYARVEHAKYAVADDRSSVIGTGNWEWSYFNTAVDASVFVKGKGPAETLTRIFDRDWNGPYVTTLQPGQNYEAPRTE
ncbi:phospholipase D-like domain-containing protein [Xanthomonas sp. A2111]|uniref:Phospholipase D-like domain-containing protein n=1 Tax=Xanthomonas hawaiiensis TaxID=3003247 RepID=A0ABU2HZ14_9XANT|nr:phospholipase D-like domain-containing protein [Xanthomonas sp. A2111]MDS9991155.1 phospholipase D-like domain-containing protein [Xanthomonas sp. A2111]